MALAPGARLGPYEIQAAIVVGGMGEVYEARDTRLDRTVAIKVLPAEISADPDRRARFKREAKTIAGLSHPHICTLFDVGEHEGSLFLVMELLDGESLRTRLCQSRAAMPAIVDTAIQLADALECAHAKGIIHRDLKPENIHITTRGTAKLLDFGIAKLATEQAAATAALTTTRAGTGPVALGTVAYMSPEQVRGEPLDTRTDLFSLGVVLYEMATGTAPFRGATSGAVLGEILTMAPTAPVRLNPNVPADLERLINKLLEKDRALRCQSAADVRADLERLKRALTNPVVATPSEQASIVVLPFENLSPDPDNAYFADGLTEEIIADLSAIRALRVISRTSAMMFKNARKSAPAIAQELNVRHVLEGSVRRTGNHLRITALLIDAATDAHLWAEKYTGTLDDVFDLQERLSRRIVEALKGTLTPDEDRHLASREIPDVEAYALFLRARQEIPKASEESLDLAQRLIDRALARTGPNALLLATAAELGFWYHDQGIRPVPETLDRADALAARALELAPDLALAHVAKGLIAWRRFDTWLAVRHLTRAVALDPGSATAAWSAGYVLAEVGRTDEARELGDRARALDPLFWPAGAGSLLADIFDGRFDSALAKGAAMHATAGGIPVADFMLGMCLMYAGDTEEAAAVFARGAAGGAGTISAVQSVLGAALRGDRDAVRGALIDPATRTAFRNDKEAAWLGAAACASVGDADEALDWLSAVIDMGFINHRFFAEHDPFLATLRGDPRFDALMDLAREKQRAGEV
jgi:serine/threonine protein kinase